MIWLWISAAAMLATAFAHSYFGERRLIGPILDYDSGVMTRQLARQVTRFAWHFTSILMLLSALLVVWPGTPRTLILIAGVTWLAVGLFDAIYTRGRHIGWPLLSAAGLAAIIGAWQ